ncbi:hypothetical protein CR513_15788, partial [Mucuna pruriens]
MTSDLEHSQQHAIVRNQRNHSTQNVEHPTNICPTLQETEQNHPESVGSIVQTGACLRAKATINNRIQDARCHRSNNSSSSRKRHHQLAASNLEFQQNMSAIVQDLKKQKPRSTGTESKPDADSQVPQQARLVPVPFLSRTISARKVKSDEELLKMFRKLEINIPLLDAIKQIPST